MMSPPAARLALVLLSCVVWMLYSCADGLTDLSGATNSGPTCDTAHGWISHLSKCYKKMEATNGWQGARYDCTLEGGDLVSFADETVEDFVKGQMGDKPFWIGLSTLNCDDEWCWFYEAGEKELIWSNTSMTPKYTNWDTRQKGSADVKSCAYVNQGVQSRSQPGKWRHGSCQSSLAYMCERRLTACSNGRTCSRKESASISDQLETSFCNSGEFLYKDSCYHFEGPWSNWQAAEDFCKKKGGHLASVHSLVDGEFLAAHARAAFNMVGLKRTYGNLEWTDGSRTNDVPWLGGHKKLDGCAQMYWTGKVGMWPCDQVYPPICQKGKARDSFEFRVAPTSESAPIIPEATCNAKVGWTLHGSHCYKKMETANGWLGARHDCLWEGGDLVSITSTDEEDFVKRQMGDEPFWIGLSNLDCKVGWCQFLDAGEKELTWSDTSMTPNYTNWHPRQKGSSNVESCAYVNQGVDLYNQPGKWRHGSCGSSLAYMCKWSPDDCPDGWPCSYKDLGYRYDRVETSFCDSGEFLYKDSCYRFEGTRRTWQLAEKFCKDEGGHLASVHSLVVGQFLFAHVRRDGQGWLAWLGLKKNDVYFEWSDTSSPDDVPWYNSYRSSDCSKLAFDGKAHPTQCNGRRPSICQKGKAREFLPLLLTPTSASGKSAKCGWWQENPANDFCYLIDSKATKTWKEARDKCARLSGNLLGMADSQEHAFVQGLLPNNASLWLDTNDTTVEDGSERSARSSPDSVQLAAAGDPSGPRCNSLLGGEGGPEVGDCEKKRGYVCKRRVIHTCETNKGWRRFGSNCYKKMETTNGWLGARYDCLSEGGDLASITSPYEETFVKKQMGDEPFWIGLSNLNCNKTWCQFFQVRQKRLTWSNTAEKLNYVNWHSGQDGRANAESCAYVNQGVHLYNQPGKWRHGSCESSLAYMCKRSPDDCPEGRLCSYKDYGFSYGRVETSDCDPGDFLYKGSCYHFWGMKQTWKEAEKFCRELKGHLASVHSLDDGQFLAGHMPYKEGLQSWVGLKKHDHIFEWSDATPAGKIEWVPHRPAGRGDCAALSQTGKLEDWPCTDIQPFICKKAKVQDFLLPPPPGRGAKCGWWQDRPSSDFCYLIQHRPTKAWKEARDDCLRHGGDLLSIANSHEQAFIQSLYTLLPSAPSLWLGINNNITKDGSWWTDGSPLGYVVMDGDDPSEPSGASCLSLLTSNNRWKFDDCQKKGGYICKKRGNIPKLPQQPHDALIDPKASCDAKNGWNPHGSNCYKKMETTNGWLGARHDCLWEGGDLVSIVSPYEESFVKKQMGDEPFWIGLSNLDCNKDWCQFFEEGEKKLTWSDTGVTPAYANRDSRQDGSSNVESCAYVNQGVYSQPGKWRHGSCGSSLAYMCKRSPDDCLLQGGMCSYKNYGLGYHRVETSFCDPGDFLYKGSCYHFGRMERTWKDADKFCRESKGHLASVLSWDEGKFLAAHAPYVGGLQSWVGLKKNEGNFEWSDATPAGKIEWVPDRPAGRGDCAALSQTGKLEDWPCTNLQPFICKEAMVRDFLLPLPAGWSAKCGWWLERSSSDFCYLIQRKPTKAWTEARDDCLRHGGDLLSITDSQEQKFIESIYTFLPGAPSLWLGFDNNVTKDGSGWTDGSPFGYIVMDGDDPGDPSGASCLSLLTSNNRWKFDDCRKKRGYICKKRGDTPKAPQRPHNGFKEILVCNKHSADLVCEAEGQKQSRISIQSAFYGRRSDDVCQEDSYDNYSFNDDDSLEDETTCSVEGIVPRYRKLCNSQQRCHIELLEDASCPAPSKYLHMVYSCEQKVCLDSLGVADGSVADSSFKASSSMEDTAPEKARLNGESCWKPSKNPLGSWIMVNLGYTRKVTAIVTQGCDSTDARSWDIPLEMRLSVDRKKWTKHPDGKFVGGGTHLLETPAFAQYVLILPLENRPEFGLRFDILGCPHEDETTCSRKFNSVRFTDSMTFYCPPRCGKEEHFVAGTWVYSEESHICAAAIHAGVIRNDIGGDCIVMRAPKPQVYTGSTGNGITSKHLNDPLGVSHTFADGEPRCAAPDWEEFAGFCYKTFEGKKNWADAQQVCRGFGAELVSIRSEMEQASVKNVSHLETSDMWTGLNDLALPGTLVWSDRREVTFTHWAAGEPIQRVGLDQHCVAVLRQTGRWKRMSCARVNSFMCKMPTAHFPIAAPEPQVAP